MIAARRIVTAAIALFGEGFAASEAFDMAVGFERARKDTNPLRDSSVASAEGMFDAWVDGVRRA